MMCGGSSVAGALSLTLGRADLETEAGNTAAGHWIQAGLLGACCWVRARTTLSQDALRSLLCAEVVAGCYGRMGLLVPGSGANFLPATFAAAALPPLAVRPPPPLPRPL